MRPALHLVGLMALSLCACAGSSGSRGAASPEPAGQAVEDPTALLQKLADEIDPGPVDPIWPRLPAEIRREIEKGTPAPAALDARASEAAKRLESLTFNVQMTDPDAWRTHLRGLLEGLYLAEPVALGPPSPAQARCAALLERSYLMLSFMPKMMMSFASIARMAGPEGERRAQRETAQSQAIYQVLGETEKMRLHLSALILRSGQPAEAVSRVLIQLARDSGGRGDVAKGKEIAAEVVRREGAAVTAEQLVLLASLAYRAGDVRTGDEAAGRIVVPSQDERAARSVSRDKERLINQRKLAAQIASPAQGGLAERLAYVDALLSLERVADARTIVEALLAEAPRDARVRVRLAQVAFLDGSISGDVVGAAASASKVLASPSDLDTRDGIFYAFSIGLFGIRMSSEIMPLLAKDPSEALLRAPALAAELRGLAEGLAKFDPGRAAVLLYLLDKGMPLIDKAIAHDAQALADTLRAAFDDARALVKQHPSTADAYRLLYSVALFAPSPDAAIAAVAERPRVPSVDDPELFRQRATTLVALVGANLKPEKLSLAEGAAKDVDGGSDADEAVRWSVLGDSRALAQVIASDGAGLADAASLYERALPLIPPERRPRLLNNTGFALLRSKDRERALSLLRSATEEKSNRIWVPRLNLLFATVPAEDTAPRISLLEQITAAEMREADDTPPPVLGAWLAYLLRDRDPQRAAAFATAAANDLRAPTAKVRPSAVSQGVETEGSFELSLGSGSAQAMNGYLLRLDAAPTLWLMPKAAPLSLDDLDAISRKGASKSKGK